MIFLITSGLLLVVIWNVHQFLAITNRVTNSDILVVETWVPEIVVRATAREFKEGNYRLLLISGIREYNSQDNLPQNVRKSSVANRIVAMGISRNRIIECYATETDSQRSEAMAIAVRDTLLHGGIATKGVNLIAPAAHARKTWLVYHRTLASEAPVGIIAVPTGDYDPAHWWRTTQGAKWVISNGIGWVYEWFAGP